MDLAIETALPASLPEGRSTALFLAGRAVGVRSLALRVDGVEQPVAAQRMPRADLGERAGWWAIVDVHPRAPAVRIAAGDTVLAEIPVRSAPRGAAPLSAERSGRIGIAMATYEPDPALFARQIASLRAQTDARWTCVISDDGSSEEAVAAMRAVLGDDERFVLDRSPERRVFYKNFERALTLVPPEAGLVALCDQDDVWYPEKLATLRAALGDAPLAYSEQRLVAPDGALVRASLWNGRRPNHESLTSLLVAGGITGAAMLVRREVADLAIPFPETPGMDFHDHWIALVALALGEIAFVDRPLYDYVQHGGAVFGRPERIGGGRGMRWRSEYFGGYVQRAVFARALLARLGDRIAPGKRAELERYLAAERSPVALARLAARPLRRLAGRNETLGSEGELAAGVLWRHAARALRDSRCPDAWTFRQKHLQRWRWQ